MSRKAILIKFNLPAPLAIVLDLIAARMTWRLSRKFRGIGVISQSMACKMIVLHTLYKFGCKFQEEYGLKPEDLDVLRTLSQEEIVEYANDNIKMLVKKNAFMEEEKSDKEETEEQW